MAVRRDLRWDSRNIKVSPIALWLLLSAALHIDLLFSQASPDFKHIRPNPNESLHNPHCAHEELTRGVVEHAKDLKALSLSLVASLTACAKKKDLYGGTRLHAHIRTSGLLEKYPYLGNTLVSMYAKCGALSKAQQVLHELPVRNVVSWNALIAGYAKQGKGEEALDCYDRMQSDGLSPNAITYICVLKACGITNAVDRGEQFRDEIVSQGLLGKDVVLGTALVNMYAKCGVLTKAEQVLNELPVRDVVSWSALIAGYAQKGQGEAALECYERMQSDGFFPNAITYICILKACGTIGAFDRGKQIHDEIVRQGLFGEDVALGNALLNMYAKCGALGKAQQVLDELPVRDVVSWSALIGGYAQKGQGEESLICYERMRSDGLSPDAMTYACILKACGITREVDRGKQIHDEILSQRLLEKNVVLGNALVDMYAKCGELARAQQMFDELPVRDIVSWNALIAGYSENGQAEEALDCYEGMRSQGLSPNAITYTCILKACGIIGEVDKGKQIHDEIVSQELLGEDVLLGTALVDMYVKCGMLIKAQEVLDKLPVRNIVSWNALITGYAQQGQDEEVLDCFQRMEGDDFTPNTVSWNALVGGYAQEGKTEEALACFQMMQSKGISPDAITFVYLLNACSHSGLVYEGQKYFENMREKYGITPEIEHHTCMIDLFGRAGHFDKAMTLIKKMPSFDYPPLWYALLDACQKWGNVNLGRLAFEHLVQLDEGVAAPYVCMAKIYADAKDCTKD